MNKGAIVLVPFPFTDLSGNKVRPCVVLYEQKKGDDCIVAFISSVRKYTLSPFDIRIRSTSGNGLKKDSVLKIDKLATLQKKIVLGELGALETQLLKQVDTKLRALFKLS